MFGDLYTQKNTSKKNKNANNSALTRPGRRQSGQQELKEKAE
jgi:hypothetical protein